MNPQFGSGQPISARCQLGQLNDWGDSVIRGLTQAHVRLLSGGDPISSGWESEPLSICSSIWSLQPGGSRGDLTCCSEIPGACPKMENCISISPDITAEAATGSPDPRGGNRPHAPWKGVNLTPRWWEMLTHRAMQPSLGNPLGCPLSLAPEN